MNIESIKNDPSSFYDTPENLVADERIKFEEKVEILESWALQLKSLMEAENENMPGDTVAQQLTAVNNCLLELKDNLDK